jgi:hypothetical protein
VAAFLRAFLVSVVSFSRSRGVQRVVNERTGDVSAEFAYNCVCFFINTVPDSLVLAAVIPGRAFPYSSAYKPRISLKGTN